jgi:hypothetical protein
LKSRSFSVWVRFAILRARSSVRRLRASALSAVRDLALKALRFSIWLRFVISVRIVHPAT